MVVKNQSLKDILVHLNAVLMTVQWYEIKQGKRLKLSNKKY